MSDFISFKSSSPLGDAISMMPSLRQVYRQTGKKCIFYQALNVVGQGDIHVHQPFLNQDGQSIMMGEETFKRLVPLLKKQSYIEDVVEFAGQKADYDMDEIRFKTFTNQSMGSLHRAAWYAFPEMACDLSEPSIELKEMDTALYLHPSIRQKVIINFTPRFRNNWINYFFLKEHQHRLLFAGLEKERDEFCKQWGLDIFLFEFNDFYELSLAINSCKFFMSNQTGFFFISENLKSKRLLETCPQLPHVIPMGANGFDYYHQQSAELYFNKLINE